MVTIRWHRSTKGNLTTTINDVNRATVFKRYGSWRYSLSVLLPGRDHETTAPLLLDGDEHVHVLLYSNVHARLNGKRRNVLLSISVNLDCSTTVND